MKYIFAMMVFIIVGLIGCDAPRDHNREFEDRVIESSELFREYCVDGVVYYNRVGAGVVWFAPAFDKDTKQVRLCNDNTVNHTDIHQ